MHFKPGTVIYARVPFRDSDQSKLRPVLVISFHESFYTIAPITGTNKTNRCLGLWIIKDSATGTAMGITKDSFVDLSNIKNLPVEFTAEKIGVCPIFNELMDILKAGPATQGKLF